MFTQFLKLLFTLFERSKFTFLVLIKKYFFSLLIFEDLKLTKKKQFIYFLIFFYHLVRY